MIELCAVAKVYGQRQALIGIDLHIEPGQVVLLVGPNGAGKTTLLRIVATLARPTSGAVRVAGLDPAAAGPLVRRRIGYLAHHTLLVDDLSVDQNLRFFARLYGVAGGAQRADELLSRVGMVAWRREPVRVLSRGMQQRVAIARTLLHGPSVLLLDEPYSGLDAAAGEDLRALLAEQAAAGATILLATHDPRAAPSSGSRVIAMAQGRIVSESWSVEQTPLPA